MGTGSFPGVKSRGLGRLEPYLYSLWATIGPVMGLLYLLYYIWEYSTQWRCLAWKNKKGKIATRYAMKIIGLGCGSLNPFMLHLRSRWRCVFRFTQSRRNITCNTTKYVIIIILGSIEITNKIQPCNRIYYFTVHWRLIMFRAAYRSLSGALTVFAASGLHTFTSVCTRWMYQYCVLYLAWWFFNWTETCRRILILISNICCVFD